MRPAILLPATADTWDEQRRRAVLLHELAHVARFDCLSQWAACAMRAVYWMHPGAWWLVSRLRLDREFACDDLVLAAGAPPAEYARHLLDIAYTFGGGRAPALAVRMARRSQIEGRLRALLDDIAHASRAVAAGTRGHDHRRVRGAAAAGEHDLAHRGPARRRAGCRDRVCREAPATLLSPATPHAHTADVGARTAEVTATASRTATARVTVARPVGCGSRRGECRAVRFDGCRGLHLGGAARHERRRQHPAVHAAGPLAATAAASRSRRSKG